MIMMVLYFRYLGITSSVSRKWTHKRVLISLLFIWVFSFVVYIPNIYVIKHKQQGRDCYESFGTTARISNVFFLVAVEYILPLLIIGFCNYKIIKIIKGRKTGQLGIAQLSATQEAEQKRSLRMLVAIVLGFAIICLPNQILFVYLDIAEKRYKENNVWDILQVFGVLLLLHTSFNPAVYSIMDKKFRADAKAVCCCCCSHKETRKQRGSSSGSAEKTKLSLVPSSVDQNEIPSGKKEPPANSATPGQTTKF